MASGATAHSGPSGSGGLARLPPSEEQRKQAERQPQKDDLNYNLHTDSLGQRR